MLLEVPALPCVVDARVFDAYGWCASDVLEWRRPETLAGALPTTPRIVGDNPAGLVFVLRDPARTPWLPRELARLHAFGYGLEGEEALAPYAIDDATDLLHAHRVPPREALWLAADSLAALVWGLHDWVHFHNHGPFERPAMTELQCDLVAVAWLRHNAGRIGIDAAATAAVAADLAALCRRRFAEEGEASPVADLDALFAGPFPAAALG